VQNRTAFRLAYASMGGCNNAYSRTYSSHGLSAGCGCGSQWFLSFSVMQCAVLHHVREHGRQSDVYHQWPNLHHPCHTQPHNSWLMNTTTFCLHQTGSHPPFPCVDLETTGFFIIIIIIIIIIITALWTYDNILPSANCFTLIYFISYHSNVTSFK